MCLLTLLSPVARLNWHAPNLAQALLQGYPGLPVPVSAVISLTALGLLGWLFGVNEAWVKQAGEQYAVTLLACCDRLS